MLNWESGRRLGKIKIPQILPQLSETGSVSIALLENDKYEAEILRAWLLEAGARVRGFETALALMQALRTDNFDLFLLDWSLPDMAGCEVLKRLRTTLEISSPAIFLSSRPWEEDLVLGFAVGADDYIVKPINKLEMLSRIRAVIRRSLVCEDDALLQLKASPYIFDLKQRRLFLREQELSVTSREFDLALCLFRNVNRVISRAYILSSVWQLYGDQSTRSLDTFVCTLRKNLQLRSENGYLLKSVYGVGYRLVRIE